MLSVFLQGGLGNQLFEIFTTIGHALKMNCMFIFTYDETLKFGIERNTYWDSFLSGLEKYTTKYSDESLTNDEIVGKFMRYNEVDFHYTELPAFSEPLNIILWGYFQSYRYFHEYRNDIFGMIQLKVQQKKVVEKYSEYLDKKDFTSHKKIISMHFRIGDYITKTDYHCILPYEYYSKAMIEMQKTRCDILMGRVLYFCEAADNDTVNAMIERLKKENPLFEFVKVDDTIADWEQMLIMSCCDVNIMANSTFSWWGAYFNGSSVVFYPSRWFGPKLNRYNLKDLHLPEWNRIDI